MNYVIISFKSRTQTLRFAEILKSKNIYYEVVNTPREAYIGCGLSLKAGKSDLYAIKRLVAVTGFSSFAGIFEPYFTDKKVVLRRIA